MLKISPVEIREASVPDDLIIIKKLWIDYLTWGNNQMQWHYGEHPHNPDEATDKDLKMIEKFMPPHGRLIIAFVGNKACGIGCLKRINEEIGEIKRMYVDPSFRKNGIGRAILKTLVSAAKESGYQKLRLDSPKFMKAAHALYQSFGFNYISAYEEGEIPEKFRAYLLFMELKL